MPQTCASHKKSFASLARPICVRRHSRVQRPLSHGGDCQEIDESAQEDNRSAENEHAESEAQVVAGQAEKVVTKK